MECGLTTAAHHHPANGAEPTPLGSSKLGHQREDSGTGSPQRSRYLPGVVEGEPVEEDVGEELGQAEDAVHHPVRQPRGVILLAGALNGFDAAAGEGKGSAAAALLPGWAPPPQALQTPEQTCLPGAAAPRRDRARSQHCQEGLKSFPTTTACSFARETLGHGQGTLSGRRGEAGLDAGTYETYAG